MPEMQNTYARPHMANVLFLIYLQVLFSMLQATVASRWQLHLGGSAPAYTLPAPDSPRSRARRQIGSGADWAEN